MSKLKALLIVLLVALSYAAFTLGGVFAVAGIWVSGYAFYQLLTQEDRWIPIGEIALSMAAFQWIISPLISYTMPVSMFTMSQDCSTYMMYTVPMYCCFMFGYQKFKKPFGITIEELQTKCLAAEKLARIFIAGGLIVMLVPTLPAFAQISKYISQLMYIGFIMLMIAKPPKSTLYFALPVVITLLLSLRGAMFHELMTWSLLMLMIWFKTKQVSVVRQIVVILICVLAVNTLQTIKATYRQVTWYNGGGANVSLFVDLMVNSASASSANPEEGADNNSRYNQGWIISMIYDNVPKNHDYFYGRTYKDAIVATLLPRFLAPNKKGSGQQVQTDFREMTGYPLNDNTSMGLSILGESYGNFGLLGGALFMLFWGWFIAKVLDLANIWAQRKSFLWILMLPIVCFVLVEAEISMITVLNWTIKGMIFAFILIYYCKRRSLVS